MERARKKETKLGGRVDAVDVNLLANYRKQNEIELILRALESTTTRAQSWKKKRRQSLASRGLVSTKSRAEVTWQYA